MDEKNYEWSKKEKKQFGITGIFLWTLTFATDKDFVEKVYVQEEGPDSHSDCMKRKKVLIVKDNDMNLEIIQFMLEDWDAETVSARNGKEALDSFRQSEQNEFDYIFMDIMMPVMDGLTATKEIRRLNRPDAATIPIIAMSANAFAEDVAKAKQAGVTEYLVKPLDSKKLQKILKKQKH